MNNDVTVCPDCGEEYNPIDFWACPGCRNGHPVTDKGTSNLPEVQLAAILTPDVRPAPGSVARQSLIDQLAAVNAALSYLAADAVRIRLHARDPLALLITQLFQNSDRALSFCAAVLESEQKISG